MTWTKLGAEFPDEISSVSDAAFRTHVEALCWSNRRLLDLAVPKTQLRKFAETADPDVATAELVAAGWWRDDGATWYIGVHFAEWQRDRVQVEHLRQRKARDQQRKRRHDLGDHSLCLPGRCKALSPGDGAGDEAGEAPGDATGDGRGDPERNGTAQIGYDRDPARFPSRVSAEADRRWASGFDS